MACKHNLCLLFSAITLSKWEMLEQKRKEEEEDERRRKEVEDIDGQWVTLSYLCACLFFFYLLRKRAIRPTMVSLHFGA